MTAFSDKVDRLTRNITRARSKVKSLEKELKLVLQECPHDKLIEKSHYYPGSYYDKSFTEKYDECAICGKRVNFRTSDGYYG